ncbi:MAG TPA: DUF2130 domain-containing protein [Mariniphaga anaerophila]|uniref:DUF2130 domain-containing protein n=1 Tax=Mariniphaga anaerophila TaxID=1484053 RepID=A0A831LBE9_9BACT|nr:DUF2130 domain-containing protein [Mariniphaga anaerophila]
MKNESKITCPNCQTEIDVQDVLAHQVEVEIKKVYDAKMAATQEQYKAELKKLSDEKAEFEEKKRKENVLFQQRLEAKLSEERKQIAASLKSRIEKETSEQFDSLQKELNEKSEKLKELNKSKAEIERLKREKEEQREAIEAESQKKLNQLLTEEKERIRRQEQENNELKMKELQKKLDDQVKLTEEMKRKQEQGSMQLQGEVQELAIEEWLSNSFPLDTIEEIKKGARGADCLQTVHTRTRQNCGTIYYESKRTKDFQAGWIEKFKNDMRDKGATIGVLVTEAMPSDMERMGMREGIWICSFEEFKGLCFVLRETVVQLSNAVASQENKGDKMSLLYDFLTSNTFRMQVEAIVEGFSQMKADLEKEKNAMQRIWKQRDKQIEKVITNTIDMYGSIKGIAGNAIQDVKALELPGVELEENEENDML